MAFLARLFDFTPATVIASSAVDSEFDQLVAVLNGQSSTKQIQVAYDSDVATDDDEATLIVGQDGAAPIQVWEGPAGPVARITVLGGFEGPSILLNGATPTIRLDDTAGSPMKIYDIVANAGQVIAQFTSASCKLTHVEADNRIRSDAIMDYRTRLQIGWDGAASIGANNKLTVNADGAPSLDVSTTLYGDVAIRPLEIVGESATTGDLVRAFDKGDVSAVRVAKFTLNQRGKITTRAVLSGTETADLLQHGGTLKTQTAQTANSGTGETDLFTYTCPANLFGANGDHAEFIGSVYLAANSNSKRIRVFFGGSVIATIGFVTDSDRQVYIHAALFRTASDTVRIALTMHYSAAGGTSGALTGVALSSFVTSLTLSNTQIFKITGTGDASNDVTVNTAMLHFYPANA